MGTEKKEKRKEGDAGTREGHNRRKDHKKGKGSRDRAAQRDREKEERGDARDRDTASTRKKRELSLLSQRRAENLRKAHPREAAGRRSAARAFTPPGTPAFCKRRPSGSPARASRGGDSLRGGGPGSLRFLLPSPPRGGYREYLSCRGPAVPPPASAPPPAPHSRSRSTTLASTARPARLGAHVPRLLPPVPWTLCGRAAEPQSSFSSCSSGSSCSPSGSALGRRRRCSADRRRDPRGETSATPKVKSWRRAPGSARSPRLLPRVAAAAKEGRREGGVGAAGEGWEAPCSLYPGPHC